MSTTTAERSAAERLAEAVSQLTTIAKVVANGGVATENDLDNVASAFAQVRTPRKELDAATLAIVRDLREDKSLDAFAVMDLSETIAQRLPERSVAVTTLSPAQALAYRYATLQSVLDSIENVRDQLAAELSRLDRDHAEDLENIEFPSAKLPGFVSTFIEKLDVSTIGSATTRNTEKGSAEGNVSHPTDYVPGASFVSKDGQHTLVIPADVRSAWIIDDQESFYENDKGQEKPVNSPSRAATQVYGGSWNGYQVWVPAVGSDNEE